MTTQNETPRRLVILADESANWIIAGLRQLDRLVLTLNRYLRTTSQYPRTTVCVFWKPEIPSADRWVPTNRKISRLDLTADAEAFFERSPAVDLVLTTRLFLHRDALGRLPFQEIAAPADPDQGIDQSWQSYLDSVEETYDDFPASDAHPWEYVAAPGAIAGCERRFLGRNGKSQDGWVSKNLNRPVSQRVTRLLLKFPMMPSTWTWVLMFLPLAGSLVLLRGDYAGFVLGTALYQLYSMLDGCDGEIARAKFLETERGRRLDTWCDIVSTVLLVVSLGYGLSREGMHMRDPSSNYLLEGIAVAVLILINEVLLTKFQSNSSQTPRAAGQSDALYPRHARVMQHAGISVDEGLPWWLLQLTKRDLGALVFLLLAVVARPEWILHLLGVVAAGSLLLVGKSFVRRRASRRIR